MILSQKDMAALTTFFRTNALRTVDPRPGYAIAFNDGKADEYARGEELFSAGWRSSGGHLDTEPELIPQLQNLGYTSFYSVLSYNPDNDRRFNVTYGFRKEEQNA